jgi:multiple sugar transport system permease protein
MHRLYAEAFRPGLPRHELWPIHIQGLFYYDLLARYGDVSRLNAAMGADWQSFESIELALTYPAGRPEAPLWEHFVRQIANLRFLRLRPSSAPAYQKHLLTRYSDIEAYNQAYGTHWSSFDQTETSTVVSPTEPGYSDFRSFIQEGDCLAHVEIDSFEGRWREFLRRQYGSIEKCAAAHGRSYESFETLPLRLDEYDAYLMHTHKSAVLGEFLSRNYLHVIDFLALRGNALKVTLWFVGLSVLSHLLINPLAAYALSRYRLRWGHWILLFCVLTMAFPAEVGSIPRFLLIRELGMLNTIWALVLPGVAHGFSIFILKSFFDGLPQELYEASLLEGASERWMFWNVTVALTKPILAVTAFGAFTGAYGSFMFALIIAPDPSMWTISVWLYQFQQQATEPARLASLVVASIPILLAFLVMQRFILRGIVLPVER